MLSDEIRSTVAACEGDVVSPWRYPQRFALCGNDDNALVWFDMGRPLRARQAAYELATGSLVFVHTRNGSDVMPCLLCNGLSSRHYGARPACRPTEFVNTCDHLEELKALLE